MDMPQSRRCIRDRPPRSAPTRVPGPRRNAARFPSPHNKLDTDSTTHRAGAAARHRHGQPLRRRFYDLEIIEDRGIPDSANNRTRLLIITKEDGHAAACSLLDERQGRRPLPNAACFARAGINLTPAIESVPEQASRSYAILLDFDGSQRTGIAGHAPRLEARLATSAYWAAQHVERKDGSACLVIRATQWEDGGSPRSSASAATATLVQHMLAAIHSRPKDFNPNGEMQPSFLGDTVRGFAAQSSLVRGPDSVLANHIASVKTGFANFRGQLFVSSHRMSAPPSPTCSLHNKTHG